jgi:transposase InsO family protein
VAAQHFYIRTGSIEVVVREGEIVPGVAVESKTPVDIQGQYTGYNAPDDNAYVERIIRTIKEEEIWPNLWDTPAEAREAIEAYVTYYNNQRIHSALNYRTPSEVAAAFITRAVA